MSVMKKFRSAAGSDRVLEVWKGRPSGTVLVAVGDEDDYTDISVNAIDLRDYLLEVYPLDDQESAGPEPEEHPSDGFKQRVDRAVEAAAKAAGKAYIESYAEAFRTALVEDEDRPLQVGDRVKVTSAWSSFLGETGTVSRIDGEYMPVTVTGLDQAPGGTRFGVHELEVVG